MHYITIIITLFNFRTIKTLNDLICIITVLQKCFVTSFGIRSLLEHLPHIEQIDHSGEMGQVFDNGPLEIKFDEMHTNISHFSQMESLSSGSIENEDEDDWGELRPWIPCQGKRITARITVF